MCVCVRGGRGRGRGEDMDIFDANTLSENDVFIKIINPNKLQRK